MAAAFCITLSYSPLILDSVLLGQALVLVELPEANQQQCEGPVQGTDANIPCEKNEPKKTRQWFVTIVMCQYDQRMLGTQSLVLAALVCPGVWPQAGDGAAVTRLLRLTPVTPHHLTQLSVLV